MCDCHLAELYAKAAKEQTEAKALATEAWKACAEKSKRIEELTVSLQEERDALRLAEAEIAALRSRLEERRPGGVTVYEGQEWKKEDAAGDEQ